MHVHVHCIIYEWEAMLCLRRRQLSAIVSNLHDCVNSTDCVLFMQCSMYCTCTCIYMPCTCVCIYLRIHAHVHVHCVYTCTCTCTLYNIISTVYVQCTVYPMFTDTILLYNIQVHVHVYTCTMYMYMRRKKQNMDKGQVGMCLS